MEDSKGDQPTKTSGKIRIVLEVHREDAERLKKAFESGMLDYLGIEGVNVLPPPESDQEQKTWASDEQTRQPRQNKPNEKTPPLPG
jgi:hypothetical protein